MHVLGEGLNVSDHIFGQMSSVGNLLGEVLDLGVSRNLPRQQQPQHTLRQRLRSIVFSRFRQFLIAFRNCVSSERDSSLRVQDRNVVEQPHYVSHTSQCLVKSYLLDDFISVFLSILFYLSLFDWNKTSQSVLQLGF